eukprot:TRINITY_DN17306_c0_g1_i1.p1 TRINITY_DN17306_c0_g1~~TRINITY_DN17306_c0_g1_i1.p1  ORF type:complete len:385 (+),score=72.28 TRINITY_DN17306_c0_g1_i1:79-1233(+)
MWCGTETECIDDGISVASTANSEGPTKLFVHQEKQEDKLVAVVITIFEGASYDKNFRVMEPKTVPGERVSTYSLGCCDVGKLHDYLANIQSMPGTQATWRCLLEDINSVHPDSVTLNWECCGGCSESGFPSCSVAQPSHGRARSRFGGTGQTTSPTMQLMGLAVRRGFTVMCSDFSLKALIAEWSEEQLGPNPFVKLQEECDHQFQLDFVPSDLQNEEVPQQLQVVGELCSERGSATVSAMSGTIVYTVNPRRSSTGTYDLKVLTVVDKWCGGIAGIPEAMKCSVGSGEGEKRGAAGHVTLTYASGGQLLTSMGHWIELTRIDTGLAAVEQVLARNFGQDEFMQFSAERDALSSDFERQEHMQRWSKELVQKSVPTRMKMRTKF